MNAELLARIKSYPSTILGIVSALVLVLQASLKCEVSLTDFGVWVPSAVLLIWGVLTKGAPK
jgi:hypothetical protein